MTATATATATAPRSARAEARRDELLTQVMAFVRTDGPFLTMDDLAGACGVTKPILYRHFDDRDGLMAAMAERFLGELVAAVGAGFADEGAPRDRMAVAVRGSLELLGNDPRLYRFLSTQAGAEKRDLLVGLVAETLAVALEAEHQAAGLPTTHVRLWSYGLIGMFHAAGDWWVDTLDDPDALSLDEVVESLLSLLHPERLLP